MRPLAAAIGLCVCALTALLPALAQPQPAVAEPVLLQLRTELERELADLQPAPVFEVRKSSGGRSLVVRYRTRDYIVYPRAKTGRFGDTLERHEGPDHDGVLIRAHVQPAGEANQALPPQTVRQPYWSTFLNAYPVPGTGKQVYLALSFQGPDDRPLLRKIRGAAERLTGGTR
jgi:hypothetical protein